MPCKHENISVYEETQYAGRLINGQVIYDTTAPVSVNIAEVICQDCEETFDDVEAEGSAPDYVKIIRDLFEHFTPVYRRYGADSMRSEADAAIRAAKEAAGI